MDARRIRRGLSAAGAAALDLLFPPACELCGGPSRGHLCEACRARILPREARLCCRVCGKLLIEADRAAGATDPLCAGCRKHPPAFTLARSAAAFHGPAGTLVRAVKYGGRTWIADVLAALAAQCFRDSFDGAAVDLAVPVPLHPARELARGFNQSALLAAGVARRLGVPMRTDLLRRVRETQTQTRMDRAGRRENMRGAFEAAPGAGARLAGKTVLVVDDVMTTGSTLDACAAALREAGAARVLALSAARD
ncbi:MAG: ComF family protein [Kiritimatiellae bacterium]|nr:ComF family protein [Kiritimatiellia bacterium]